MDFKPTFTPLKYHILVLWLLLALAMSPLCFASSKAEIKTLEDDYQVITNRLYTRLAKNLNECGRHSSSLKKLNLQVQKLSKQSKKIIGLCLIQNNLSLINENIDNKEVFAIFQFLLDNNNLLLANKLYLKAKSESDQSFLSNISFIYARYYLKRENWKKVLEYTKGTYNDLTANNANLARLFTGIALQKIKKHREAVKYYSKIPINSKNYPAARLNIATAYIRQDWWTDAHIKINEILNNKKLKTDDEMINRLYLVLGYSLLRKEFYRDSREAFRNIELNSIYLNKALLGIALTSSNQEDYIGALNAINILKYKKDYDLSVDESYILLPYIYEKLNQNMTASASYSDAQKYYIERIKNLNSIKENKLNNITAQDILNNNNHLIIENNIINYSRHFPISFLENQSRIQEIGNYIVHVKNTVLTNKYLQLKIKYNKSLKQQIGVIIDSRLAYLKSYMNQSRFGLARLYDNSNTVTN